MSGSAHSLAGPATHPRIGRWAATLAVAALLAACASQPVPAPMACDPLRAWSAGLEGRQLPPDRCQPADTRLWREANNLALELRKLNEQQRRLLALDSPSALEQARVQRDIDQIRGAAQTRGWPLP